MQAYLKTEKFLVSLFFMMLMVTTSGLAQNLPNTETNKIMKVKKQYPCVEVYYEKDFGNPDAGNDKWTDPNGKTVYGGKQDYQPHIMRKSYVIAPKELEQLLNAALHWLPYFSEQKENITLGEYFKAAEKKYSTELYNLLPKDLNRLHLKKSSDENYNFYSTLLVYEDAHPRSITVVWLNENNWFVNDVYYSVGNAANSLFKNIEEGEVITAGNFEDFLRLSPIFQEKLTEGFSNLKLLHNSSRLPLNQVVLGMALTPGLPNTKSYDIQISGDGSIMRLGNKTTKKIDLNKLTQLLLLAQQINWKSYTANAKPTRQDEDGQSFIISAWVDGILYRLQDPHLKESSTALANFIKIFKEVVDEK